MQLSRLLADILAQAARDEFVVGEAGASLQALIAKFAAVQLRPGWYGRGGLEHPAGLSGTRRFVVVALRVVRLHLLDGMGERQIVC